jgi:hypothetical protein
MRPRRTRREGSHDVDAQRSRAAKKDGAELISGPPRCMKFNFRETFTMWHRYRMHNLLRYNWKKFATSFRCCRSATTSC